MKYRGNFISLDTRVSLRTREDEKKCLKVINKFPREDIRLQSIHLRVCKGTGYANRTHKRVADL